jgi:long-chain acyl-CoA synthetase
MTSDLPVHGVGEPRPDFPSVVSMFEYAAAHASESPALTHLRRTLTYGDEALAVAGLARRLAGMGVDGATVALLLPNSIEYHVGYFAILMARGVPTLFNPAYPPAQLEPLLRDAAPRVLLCLPGQRTALAPLADRLGISHLLAIGPDGIDLETLIAEGAGGQPDLPITPDLPAALLYTGGTTGVPKGVEHSHASLMTAMRCVEWSWPTRARGEVWLPVAPMFHIFGFLTGVLAPVYGCAHVVIPERFQPELVVGMLARHRVTIFGGGPPSIYAALLAAPNLPSADLSSLRICPAGGAPVPVEILERWRRATGLDIYEGFGMTELAPISTNTESFGRKPGSVGKAVPCNRIEIVDLETGTQVLPPGAHGEIRVTGPHAMTGYRGHPEETAAVLRDGFIHTGDIGYLDEDGFLFITDRRKDVILVKGFNVFPREVEEVLITHPGVAAVGVVGVSDQRSGERIVAFVAPQPGSPVTEADLRALCEERLVAYKHPAEIRFLEDLPLTAANKLNRMRLRELAQEG